MTSTKWRKTLSPKLFPSLTKHFVQLWSSVKGVAPSLLPRGWFSLLSIYPFICIYLSIYIYLWLSICLSLASMPLSPHLQVQTRVELDHVVYNNVRKDYTEGNRIFDSFAGRHCTPEYIVHQSTLYTRVHCTPVLAIYSFKNCQFKPWNLSIGLGYMYFHVSYWYILFKY